MCYDQRYLHAVTMLAAGWLLPSLTGCSENNKLTSPPAIPAVMKSDDRTWNREGDLSADDQAVLDGYFRNHMTEIDNPLFEESAVVYADTDGARRIYWFGKTTEGTQWFYLQFDARNRFQGSDDGIIRQSDGTTGGGA